MATNYEPLARDVLAGVGGTPNIRTLVHCATRLRFSLVDDSKADIAALKRIGGVINVLKAGGQVQVVIGDHVGDVYKVVARVGGLGDGANATAAPAAGGKRRNPAEVFVDVVSGVFAPVLSTMAGAGILKGLLTLATTLGWTTMAGGTYQVLYAAADGVFYFLPFFLAFTAAKKFDTDVFTSVGLAAALVYPTITEAYSAGTSLTFLHLPVVLASYTSSVLPIIVGVYVLSLLDKQVRRVIPQVLKGFMTPLVLLVVMVPATLLVIGPITSWIGTVLASGYTAAVGFNPTVAGFVLGGLWPVIVIFGVHYGFVPIVINNLAQYGRDTLFTITGPNNVAQAGATLGVFLKTRDKDLRALSGATAVTAIVAGITEPAVYGVTLKYKRPFIIGACWSAIGGAIVATAGTGSTALVGTALLTLPAYAGTGFVAFLVAFALVYVGSALTTYLVGFNDSMIERPPAPAAPGDGTALLAPATGEAVALADVSDAMFAGGDLGVGAGVVPADGRIVAPADATVTTVFPTGHAVGLRLADGTELLVHIGFNTVALGGEHFEPAVADGQQVAAGDLLVTFDHEAVAAAGYDITTVVIVTRPAPGSTAEPAGATGHVTAGSDVLLRRTPAAADAAAPAGSAAGA